MATAPSERLLKIFEQSIREQVGPGAVIDRLGEATRTPMTFTIERAAARLEAVATTFWVSDGPPDMFCLRAGGSIAVAFGDRHVQLSAQFLRLLTMPMDKELRAKVAERLCLRVIAEFALKNRDADLAALCFMKAKVGETVIIGDTNDAVALEYEPVSERYMFMWFYGILHELGHEKAATEQQRKMLADIFPDDWVRSVIKDLLDKEDLPSDQRQEIDAYLALERMFAPAQLREESSADLFACEVLLEATRDILMIFDQRQLDPFVFLSEHILAINWLSLIEKCRHIALVAQTRHPDGAKGIWKLAFNHVAFHFRAFVAQWYLGHALREFAPGSTKATFDKAIAGLADELQPVLDAVQQGYRAAMQYTTKAKGQLEDHLLLEDFRKQLTSKVGGITSAEATFFCSRANSAGVRSDLLTQIENVAADPHAPIAEIGNGIAYLLAWVHGPNGLSVPFTLRTKYGPLCFVFLPDSQTFNDFFRISAEDLLEGFELKRTAIVAPRPEALGEMILATASEDTGFGIVWEGSKDFEEIFADLISGELFNEE